MDNGRCFVKFEYVDFRNVGGAMHILPEAYDIKSFCKAYSISRSTTYIEIAAGRLKVVKVGRRTLIRRSAAKAWLDAYEAASDRFREQDAGPNL